MAKKPKTLKEIAIELLEKYEVSETCCILEYSGDIRHSEKMLKKEINKYRKMIEAADRKDEPQFDKDINVRSKDEPQYDIDKGTIKCDNCSESGSYKCFKCDGEMYFKRLEFEDEPQTEDEILREQCRDFMSIVGRRKERVSDDS